MQPKKSTELELLVQKLNVYEDTPSKTKTSSPSPPPSSSSGYSSQNESKNAEQTKEKKFNLDEKYFHYKLQHLLNVPDNFSFSNAEIIIKKFIEEIEEFIKTNFKNNEKLDENTKDMIINEIKETLKGENKIELDSVFVEVSGAKIKYFFEHIKDYSFPFENATISEKENYVLLVESTHSLDSNIIKKTDQLRKYFLFFSLLIKCIHNYKDYLGAFQDYLIGKYFQKSFFDIDSFNKLNYSADFSFERKIIILIATDQSLLSFVQLKDKIKNSQTPFKLRDNVKKCFPNIYKIENEKKYKNEININNNSKPKQQDLSKEEKLEKYIQKKVESIQTMKLLMNNINGKETWIVKIIYFDLYLNLIEPGYSISESLKQINKTISNEIGQLKNVNIELNNKNKNLETDVESLKKQNENLLKVVKSSENKINIMLNFLKEQFPETDFSNFMEEPKTEDKENVSKVKDNQAMPSDENQKIQKNQ